MNNKNLLMAWYAVTHIKRGPMTKKDKAILKYLGWILGAVLLVELFMLLSYRI